MFSLGPLRFQRCDLSGEDASVLLRNSSLEKIVSKEVVPLQFQLLDPSPNFVNSGGGHLEIEIRRLKLFLRFSLFGLKHADPDKVLEYSPPFLCAYLRKPCYSVLGYEI